MKAVAVAHPNFALVKYWGKRDGGLNLPAVGSLSITLDTLSTRTSVSFDESLRADTLSMGAAPASEPDRAKVSRFLDRIRQRAVMRTFAQVETHNNFPTGAGLASSASGFAALAVAATRAAGLRLSPVELSALARCGSGSAARSIFGGFVEMKPGVNPDGTDAVATPLLEPGHWPLRVLVAITAEGPKDTGSTDGMERSRATSPYYAAWVSSSSADVLAARHAVDERDFAALADVAEHSCLKMHSVMLATRPPLIYWNATTLELMHVVRRLREAGTPVFYTIDAGPQLKAICPPEVESQVLAALSAVAGVRRVLQAGLGEGARIVEATE